MTREEIRRENARKLASGAGSKTEFAQLVQMELSQVSQLIGPNPKKNIGNSIARRIERAYHLPEHWLDVEHPELGSPTANDEPAVKAEPPAPSGQPLHDVSPGSGTTLERLDGEEKRLLELYRRATKEGKLLIYGAARVAPQESIDGLLFPRPQ